MGGGYCRGDGGEEFNRGEGGGEKFEVREVCEG